MLTGTANSVNLYEDFLFHKQREIRICNNRQYIKNKKVPRFSKYYFGGVLKYAFLRALFATASYMTKEEFVILFLQCCYC